jgi:methyl-accepting chemotaxis protein
MYDAYGRSKQEGDIIMSKFDIASSQAINNCDTIVSEVEKESDVFLASLLRSLYVTFFAFIIGITIITFISVISIRVSVKYFNHFVDDLHLVIDNIEKGVFFYRITNIKYNDDFGKLSRSLNNMLDQLEVFIREMIVSMEYASQKKYYRKPIPTGIRGEFAGNYDQRQRTEAGIFTR